MSGRGSEVDAYFYTSVPYPFLELLYGVHVFFIMGSSRLESERSRSGGKRTSRWVVVVNTADCSMII